MDQQFDFDRRLKAARDLYEGTHGMTFNALVDITGFSKQVLRRQAKAEGWRKIVNKGETDEALAAFDLFRKYREEQERLAAQASAAAEAEPVPDEDPQDPEAEQVTPETAQQNVSVQTASEVKAIADNALSEMLERHLREWMIPRSLSAEAVRNRRSDPARSFETAKLAKITAETLQIVQNGERKAAGLDGKDQEKGHTVVIDRG